MMNLLDLFVRFFERPRSEAGRILGNADSIISRLLYLDVSCSSSLFEGMAYVDKSYRVEANADSRNKLWQQQVICMAALGAVA